MRESGALLRRAKSLSVTRPQNKEMTNQILSTPNSSRSRVLLLLVDVANLLYYCLTVLDLILSTSPADALNIAIDFTSTAYL